MKRKITIIIFILVTLLFGTGITYSIFTSDAKTNTNQKIATFIFNSQKSDSIEIPLIDIYPSITKEYGFSVTNNTNVETSNVTINYQMIIKTYHFMPLNIKLYKVKDEKEELVMTCDETYSRNEENELVCNSPVQEMEFDQKKQDDYKIVVEFPSNYSEEEYTDLVDYIDLEINSWQKIESR